MGKQRPLKIMVVVGTRPEAIKMAPVIRGLLSHARITTRFAVTGQHRDMLDQVLQAFDLRPDDDMDIMQPNQSLTDVSTGTLTGLEPILDHFEPDMTMVHGDTLTAFSAGLASFFRRVPVAHVEAGLRTHTYDEPFPEEMNRRLLGQLAQLHLAPTQGAKANLLREGVEEASIVVTGNTVIDALFEVYREDYTFTDPVLESIDFEKNRVIMVTTHRRENVGAPLLRIYKALTMIAEACPDVKVIFPLHPNPKVRNAAYAVLGNETRVHLINPPDYPEFANLLARVHLVLTDSGGIQEEAPAFGKPVLVLRDVTERVEGIRAGVSRLVGTQVGNIVQNVLELLTDPRAYQAMVQARSPYGDGFATQRIMQAVLYHHHLIKTPPDQYFS